MKYKQTDDPTVDIAVDDEKLEYSNKIILEDRELSYLYDLFHDIKTVNGALGLTAAIERATSELLSLSQLCRDDGYPIDDYIRKHFGPICNQD